MGKFHQRIIGALEGWEDLREGHPTKLDCLHSSTNTIAEIKNAANTCNDGGFKHAFANLERAHHKYGYKPIFVMINTYENGSLPSPKCRPECVKIMNGRDFYALASGSEDFFDRLLKSFKNALPM